MSAQSEWLITKVRDHFPAARIDLRRFQADSYDLDICIGGIWCAVRYLNGRYGVGKVTPDELLFSAYEREHLEAEDAFEHIKEALNPTRRYEPD